MKPLFYLCCFVTVAIGVGFYLYPGTALVSKTAPETVRPIEKNVLPVAVPEAAATETTHVQLTEDPRPTTPPKKRCACCLSELEKVKQKRKELEMWAREMIATHGYEEGMKRVTAKSPTLAKRVQRLLEKEKNSPRHEKTSQ